MQIINIIKYYIVLYLAKITYLILRGLKLGSGYTWPGHLALSIYPQLLSSDFIRFNKGIIFISGTNGKTTTSKLISHVLQGNGFTVLSNTTGANLAGGVASTLLLGADFFGNLNYDYGVFELDEFALPFVLDQKSPDVLVLLNLSRDQLDRYGETDIIFSRWVEAVSKLSAVTKLVCYEDQPEFKSLESSFSGSVYYFSDNLDVLEGTKLRGKFNACNLNAAVKVCEVVGINRDSAINSLAGFDSAYGRGEVVLYPQDSDKVGPKAFHLFLAKNPASFSNNLPLLKGFDPERTALLFILNDNIPDGRDVSWIYDIDASLLSEYVRDFNNIYVSGTRYLDMAVRLKYAGIDDDNVVLEPLLKNAVSRLLEIPKANHVVTDIAVLPNYSAMLQLRKILTGKSIL
jgi:lipid II isoglutaminyl synthase (glutamine-hydrolysing)